MSKPFSILALFIFFSSCEKKYEVVDRVILTPVELQNVRLLDGPFKEAMMANQRWLLELEPDRLLHRYLLFSGIEPKGEIYGGWESRGISGHSLGHYISACAMMYASTGDDAFKKRVEYIIGELKACQLARKTGYIGAIPDEDRVWDEIASGDIRSQGFDLNGLWVPWYTQHKLLAGLIDAYKYADSEAALNIAIKFSDWIDMKFSNLTEEQFQRMLACEFGGMNDALAQLYEITEEEKYLLLANRFYHKEILDPLANQTDLLAGKHANTQVPKIVGAAKLYELTGSKKDSTVAAYFLRKVLADHTYANGGNSEHEHFGEPGKLAGRLSESTSETCNTYNMLKLTQHVQSWEFDSKWGDYIERAMINHILSSQNPETGMVGYFIPMQSGGQKTYSDPDDSFWCCVGSGWENHSKYSLYIYYQKSDEVLVIDQYFSSDLTLENIELSMKTDFPKSGNIEIQVDHVGLGFSTLYLRKPKWAVGYSLSINNETFKPELEKGYLKMDRDWKKGDFIDLKWNMALTAESLPDDMNKVAMFYGPNLMAGVIPEGSDELDYPVFRAENKDLNKWFVMDAANMKANTSGVGYPKDVSFKPFYEMIDDHYLVYLDLIPEDKWEDYKTNTEKERKSKVELEKRTVDLLRIGEMQPERDHELTGKNTTSGDAFNRKWRHAMDGWFEFKMEVDPSKVNVLLVTYWGGDAGNREFQILVDGEMVAEQKLERNWPDGFHDEPYAIPIGITKGKNNVTVRFESLQGKTAGGVYGVRMIKK